MRTNLLLLSGLAALLVGVFFGIGDRLGIMGDFRSSSSVEEPLSTGAPPLSGTLRLSLFDGVASAGAAGGPSVSTLASSAPSPTRATSSSVGGSASPAPGPAHLPEHDARLRHRSRFVNGSAYSGMEDNDLRGFLDGTYKYAWNQPGQVHVRVGRRDSGPRFGGYEIFRVIHRWSGIALPERARVESASLKLSVEGGPDFPLRLVLYEVKKDWAPGQGGTKKNNVSPPVRGEVWWNDAAADVEPWGLPGVGYASESDPTADTGAFALATAEWTPGDSTLVFTSDALAHASTRAFTRGTPLLLLLKAADDLEDRTASVITIYSGNIGTKWSVSRRPLLEVEWTCPEEHSVFDREILLERGRTWVLPNVSVGERECLAATFFEHDASFAPTLEWRPSPPPGGDTASSADLWQRLGAVTSGLADTIDIRVVAGIEPLPLGENFQAEFHDTWILTARPEEQKVPFVFLSPEGQRHEVLARYAGDFRWSVDFAPTSLGTWRFSWSEKFTDNPYTSEWGVFDVVAANREGMFVQLERFAEEARAISRKDKRQLELAMTRFAKLERATMQQLDPASFRSEEGAPTIAALRKIREILGGGTVPDSIPRVPDGPRPWEQKTR